MNWMRVPKLIKHELPFFIQRKMHFMIPLIVTSYTKKKYKQITYSHSGKNTIHFRSYLAPNKAGGKALHGTKPGPAMLYS